MSRLKELLLRDPRWTLAVAESLTCGHLQAAIGEESGASGFFVGGLTAYTLEQKVRHLGVDGVAAAAVNCVSAKVAEQMAQGAARLFGSDVAAATTGYAEPAPAAGVARPFAWWALYYVGEGGPCLRSGRLELPATTGRVEAQARVAAAVVAELVRFLEEARR